ncbi:MAG: IS1380 family transposase [Kosmotogaceae bacterium]
MKPPIFQFVQGDEFLSSNSGLAFVGSMLYSTLLRKRINKVVFSKHKGKKIESSVLIYSMIGLLSLAKPDFDAIEKFREDDYFASSLGIINVPSAPNLRQRLDLFAENYLEEISDIVREESAMMIKHNAHVITPCIDGIVPLDIDVSPFDNSDTKKEGVSWTYKKFDGYSPIMAYLGCEGYLVNIELREGSCHCQNETETFLDESIQYAKQITKARILVRLDSGNDDIDNIHISRKNKSDFLIKRNLRNEQPAEWFKYAKKHGEKVDAEKLRPGMSAWIGDCYVERDGLNLRVVYEIIERKTNRKGEKYMMPLIEVNTWWTSLEHSPEKVIELYHKHATSEQFHSELKSDMDLERLPSGKFATNSLILILALMSYNILRLCGQIFLHASANSETQNTSKKIKRKRIRSVLQELMYLACKMVKHARKFILSFSRHLKEFPIVSETYEELVFK